MEQDAWVSALRFADDECGAVLYVSPDCSPERAAALAAAYCLTGLRIRSGSRRGRWSPDRHHKLDIGAVFGGRPFLLRGRWWGGG